ncbi:hypothetical protein [Noviherbaspirillum suwonense]|jgi:hypothetical protein|uniref:hypothetical protein n=1 Tax=Noviherbaspirillum suwonense TaxID=1224511 RepID=UPI0024B6A07A|nr:hypothetical protein [Noviherbaspirillum suwonense]
MLDQACGVMRAGAPACEERDGIAGGEPRGAARLPLQRVCFSGPEKKKPAIDIDAGFPCLLAPQLIGMDFVSE